MRKVKSMLVAFLTLCVVLTFALAASAAQWNVPGDFLTIQSAINSSLVIEGDRIMVAPGEYTGANVTKAVEIKGEGGAVINDGVTVAGLPGKVGFNIDSSGSGATISLLHFVEAVTFPIVGVVANDVTVNHNTMDNPIQAVTNFAGNGWQVHHNDIINLRETNLTGGIGVYIVGVASVMEDNVISHNKIMGTVNVDPNDTTNPNNINGSGIAIQAIGPGGSMMFNRLIKNKISLTSSSTVFPVAAIELSEVSGASGVINDNAVGFNDLRATEIQINLEPSSLDNPTNKISRNLGENRGQGLHPSGFLPPH